ncbi:MAG: methionine--tRNA ligase subunit beta, partial [Desulfobulbaceae bacterium]|nr:methionine--tRNA ligase subunit beta [Desulfobulbaceae bacterium]
PKKSAKKAQKASKDSQDADVGLISFDQFKEVDLRVAEITGAEKIKKSDRLLKLTVNAPEERTIVAGIADFYAPEELIGKQVLIAANLKPTKLMGVTSHGMVLAAKNGDTLVLSTVSGPVKAGSKVA